MFRDGFAWNWWGMTIRLLVLVQDFEIMGR